MAMPVLGNMHVRDVIRVLEQVGESDRARELAAFDQDERLADLVESGRWGPKPYEITQHQFGYIGPATSPSPWYIQDATKIQPDRSLIGKKIIVTLDKLRVYDYPGSGLHQVLFDFSGDHQNPDGSQGDRVHFTQNYAAQESEGAGVSGFPIFSGLCVPKNGVNFSCSTTNVANNDDQKILSFLNGDVFQKGITFINSINPVLPIVTDFAVGLTTAFAGRNQNVKVSEFNLGLDFSSIVTRAKLCVGSYIAAQAPDGKINWGQWGWWDNMIKQWDQKGYLPYNYIVFSISVQED